MITAYAADNATTVLSTIVTADMCKTVLNEVTGLIPVVLAFAVPMIGIRKGLSFLFNSLQAA